MTSLLEKKVCCTNTCGDLFKLIVPVGWSITAFAATLAYLLAPLRRNEDPRWGTGALVSVSAFAGVLGVILPLGLGYGAAVLFNTGGDEALFLGLTLAATSVSISAQTLMELKVLRCKVGLALLGAAVFDDILVILILSIAFVLVGESAGGVGSIVLTVVQMVAYIGIASALGLWLLPWLANHINRLPISKGMLAFVLVVCLLYSYAAEVLGGVAAITGAFLAGLFLGRTPFREEIEEGISAIAYAFFVPIFFVNIGLEVDLGAVTGSAWWFAAV